MEPPLPEAPLLPELPGVAEFRMGVIREIKGLGAKVRHGADMGALIRIEYPGGNEWYQGCPMPPSRETSRIPTGFGYHPLRREHWMGACSMVTMGPLEGKEKGMAQALAMDAMGVSLKRSIAHAGGKVASSGNTWTDQALRRMVGAEEDCPEATKYRGVVFAVEVECPETKATEGMTGWGVAITAAWVGTEPTWVQDEPSVTLRREYVVAPGWAGENEGCWPAKDWAVNEADNLYILVRNRVRRLEVMNTEVMAGLQAASLADPQIEQGKLNLGSGMFLDLRGKLDGKEAVFTPSNVGYLYKDTHLRRLEESGMDAEWQARVLKIANAYEDPRLKQLRVPEKVEKETMESELDLA